ncbi:unnamed protein product [Ectocarpus sp. 8 AP-2014]
MWRRWYHHSPNLSQLQNPQNSPFHLLGTFLGCNNLPMLRVHPTGNQARSFVFLSITLAPPSFSLSASSIYIEADDYAVGNSRRKLHVSLAFERYEQATNLAPDSPSPI